MEEGGIPITADPRKNEPFFQGPGRFGDPFCKDYATMQAIYKITCDLCQQSVSNKSKRSREPGKLEGKSYTG